MMSDVFWLLGCLDIWQKNGLQWWMLPIFSQGQRGVLNRMTRQTTSLGVVHFDI